MRVSREEVSAQSARGRSEVENASNGTIHCSPQPRLKSKAGVC